MSSLVEEATGLDFTAFSDLNSAIAASDPVLEAAGKRPCSAAAGHGVITSVGGVLAWVFDELVERTVSNRCIHQPPGHRACC